MEAINKLVAEELTKLMHSFGNLFIHVSGEGKIDFLQKDGPGWLGMIKYVVSGDIGCMKPYKGYDTCALDQAIDYLLNLEYAPHLNSSANEEFLPDDETWKKFIMDIKEECSYQGHPKPKYKFELLGGDDGKTVVTTVTLEPICNEFIVGEYKASQKAEFIGEIDDYDQPKINGCWVKVGDKIIDIELDKLIHFRHRKYQPRKGDYLLHDESKGVYIILPQADYSIH
ncbi:hypothetical protein OBP_184 [Pseudomonas phage OBP]|uniref:hypothetical protein n=1 Tax=Pseudomonas phage OBP TaxID=1124849 RepID=UPI000240D598|nr:hypothetical protein OBP_184 [Pseudomonas phage OBP]AEV89621.1 hypothetical protein OBP_184 [Pseudomonas phage OBP]